MQFWRHFFFFLKTCISCRHFCLHQKPALWYLKKCVLYCLAINSNLFLSVDLGKALQYRGIPLTLINTLVYGKKINTT